MIRNPILALAATAVLGSTATAQFCSDNSYPLRLVDANGTELPRVIDSQTGESLYQSATESVYLAFDSMLASGTYYVHVTDSPIDGLDEVLSQNDPMDRFVSVTNTAGVITLSLPFSQNPDPALFGVGLGGLGQSLLLSPFAASQYSQCLFKAWYGDVWDLSNGTSNPYLLAGGVNPQTGGCAVRSYETFRIGDGSGSDVTGFVFDDQDHDGVHDAGEPGLAGWSVQLVGDLTTENAVTDSSGHFRFANVAAGDYSVELELQANHTATTPSSFPITVCSCGDAVVEDFGTATSQLPCHSRPTCYWTSCHGSHQAQQCGAIWSSPCLNLVDRCGHHVAPCNEQSFCGHLRNADTCNMANALSAQLITMHCNVSAGYVHPDCVIKDPCLGTMTVGQLMQRCAVSLNQHPFTPPWCNDRFEQAKLKNALLRANNNEIWK